MYESLIRYEDGNPTCTVTLNPNPQHPNPHQCKSVNEDDTETFPSRRPGRAAMQCLAGALGRASENDDESNENPSFGPTTVATVAATVCPSHSFVRNAFKHVYMPG